MKRLILIITASSLAVVLLLGGVGLLVGRSLILPAVAEAFGHGFGPFAAELPPEIRDLHNLPPAERFGHFMGGQMRFTDANNQARSVSVTPGTVVSVSGNSLTIKPNDSALGGSKTYQLTGDTRIHQPGGHPWGGQGSQGGQASLTADDKVVVVSLDSSNDAKAVLIGGKDGFGPRFGPGRRGP